MFQQRERRTSVVLTSLIFMLMIAMMSMLTPAFVYAAPPAQEESGDVTASAVIPCNESPFGGVVELGKEREIFVGYVDEDVADGSLGAYRFDLTEAGQIYEQTQVTDSTEFRNDISWPAATSADLNGDGKTEFVQAFTDEAGHYHIVSHSNGKALQGTFQKAQNHTRRAMAAGDLLGLDNETEQVVIASRSASGALSITIWHGTDSSSIGDITAVWRSTIEDRNEPRLIDVAVGNLDNDGYDDIAVAILQNDAQTVQILFLEYAPGVDEGADDNAAFNLQLRAFLSTTVSGNPANLALEMADLNGDAQDSIVLLTDSINVNEPGIAPGVDVDTFDFDPKTDVLAKGVDWTSASNSFNIALATGDIDADLNANGIRRDEILVGYYSAGVAGMYHGLNIKTLRLTDLDTANPQLVTSHHWWDNTEGRNVANHLALAVDDLNRDNQDDVVAAFDDDGPSGFQLIYLSEQYDMNQQMPVLTLMDSARFDATFNQPIQLSLGDWDNDSIKGFAQGKCARVIENQITAAIFTPPFWQNIQGALPTRGGSIGRSVSQVAKTEQSLAYGRSHTMSAYAGAGVGFSLFDVFSFGASAKATAAQEYATSNKRTTGVITGTTTTVGRSWSNHALVYEQAEYNCYSYGIAEGSQFLPVDEASLRFCEYLALPNATPLQGSELDSWDVNRRTDTEWTPVVRDWSSLTLFRGDATAQSSNNATSPLAVDSRIESGSYISATIAQTDEQANPWWQVDLGSVQEIDKIRLWSGVSYTNLYVFVSDSDFRSINGHEDPANLVNAPGVRHYTLADIGYGLTTGSPSGRVTTFLTQQGTGQPIAGRYVRVQVAGTAKLSLAEVQVFGPNYVEPDRYPLNLRDPNPKDGSFEVLLFNPYHKAEDDKYVWVQVRGNLLWDGRQNPVLNTLSVTRGSTILEWSLGQEQVTEDVTASEIVNSTSIGAEIDVEVGIVAKLQGGYGEEYTDSVGREYVQATSWGNTLDMGGQITGFPAAYNGEGMEWVEKCNYRFQPYYYEVSEESNIGYNHRFPVLDYLVPDDNRSSDLEREADLSGCRNGNQPNTTLQPTNDSFTAKVGRSIELNVLANDLGSNLAITGVGQASNGTVTHAQRSITYTPNSGFVGSDSFDYTVTDGTNSTTATVTVTVELQSIYLPTVTR